MSDNISINKPINSLNTNQPLDIRTLVNSYSDISLIPNPYIGMTITVKVDETNDNKMTDYKVKSLKSNELGMNNTVIDEIERLDVYVGMNEIKSQLDTKANQSELEVERSRINLLTKIENVETEGNAELLDIRVNADGVTNSTAGETVREIARGSGILEKAIQPSKTSFVEDYSIPQILNFESLTQGQYYTSNDVSNPDKVAINETYATIKIRLEKDKKYVAFALAKDFTFCINQNSIVKVDEFENFEVYDNSPNSGLVNDKAAIFSAKTNDYMYMTFRINVDTLPKPMLFKSSKKLTVDEYKQFGFVYKDYLKIPKLKIEVHTKDIINKAITAEKTDFIVDYTATQILNYNDLDLGKYYTATDSINPGNTAINETYAIIKLKLEKGMKYVAFGVAKDFTFFTNGNTITKLDNFYDYEVYDNSPNSGLTNDRPVIFECPTDDYIYFSFRVNVDTLPKPMLFKTSNKVYLKEYKAFGEKIDEFLEIPKLKIPNKNNFLTVKPNGDGDYISLVECIRSIDDSSINNQYYIHIYGGDYDILSELGGETWLNTLTSDMNEMQGLLLPDYVHLIGHGAVRLYFEIPDDLCNEINVVKCSGLNLNRSNIIEGIEIIVKNCRYAVHDETGNKTHNVTRKFKNVRLIHNGCIGYWTSPKALGGGTGSGGRYDIINLYCESPIIPFSYHNNENQGTNIWNIDGLITKSTKDYYDFDVMFGYYKKNSNINYIYAKNCILSKTMIVKQESQSVESDNVFTLYKINVLENQEI